MLLDGPRRRKNAHVRAMPGGTHARGQRFSSPALLARATAGHARARGPSQAPDLADIGASPGKPEGTDTG
eukprot:7182075-Pyramimonas_sp.AAC.1